MFSDTNLSSDAIDMPSTSANPLTIKISNSTLLAFLKKLDNSNKQIVRCMNDLETRNTTNSMPVHSPPHNGRSVTINHHPLVHWHERPHMMAPTYPLHPKSLFTSQPVQTCIKPASHQKDGGHTASNLAFNKQLGSSIQTRPLHPDPATKSNIHLNDTPFRYVNGCCSISCANPGQFEKDDKCL